jgi:hypothetical protein
MGPPMQKRLPKDGLIERKKLPAYCSSTLTRGLTRVHLAHRHFFRRSVNCCHAFFKPGFQVEFGPLPVARRSPPRLQTAPHGPALLCLEAAGTSEGRPYGQVWIMGPDSGVRTTESGRSGTGGIWVRGTTSGPCHNRLGSTGIFLPGGKFPT